MNKQWYRIHRIRKRTGGWREILVPRWSIRHWVRQKGLSRVAAEAVGEMARAAGVGHVAHGFHLGRSPITLVRDLFGGGAAPGAHVIEYDLVDAFGSVAAPMAAHIGQCGDLPSAEMLARAATGPRWVHGYWWGERPETWGIPHVVRGGYIRVGGRYLDLVTGLERERDGSPAKIWQGAPLAPYCFERHMIPLDLMIDQAVIWQRVEYRRYADNLFFVADPIHVNHVTGAVEGILTRLGLGFRRKRVSPIGRSRVVLLGLSVDPRDGSMRLAKRTRRRLRALSHAERVRGPLHGRNRQVLQGLRALAAGVAAQR